ncbi:uncharacterized protein LOC126184268 [Schistocerca cancellata]|uniref:uncharacterized protein LOC126184268 n=1 Tax=Schistocerca cancellata TaxID=274614 RepID=UPI002118F001|nr:uncharacterized protein LOC126184268 [Schistocerca cancellata]
MDVALKTVLLLVTATVTFGKAEYRLAVRPHYKWSGAGTATASAAGPRIALLRGPPLSARPPPHQHVHAPLPLSLPHHHHHQHHHHQLQHQHHVHAPAALPPARLRRPVAASDVAHGSPPRLALRPPPHVELSASTWDDTAFRAPLHMEPFNPSPPPAPQRPPVVTTSSDDDKGPIHTIPAPNLSLDKPHRLPAATVYGKAPEHSLPPLKPTFPSVFHSGLHLPTSHSHFGATTVSVQPSHGYEVHEPTNDQAGYNVEGLPTYFAPDPDPSLPSPKVPAALEPHNVPTNNVPLPELLGTAYNNHEPDVQNALTSQDLFQLLNGIAPQGQQQPLVDSYGVPIGQQPQLVYQTALPQQQGVDALSSFHTTPDNGLLLQGDLQSPFHTYNYPHQFHTVDSNADHFANSQSYYSEQEASDSIPRVTVLRKTPESHGKPLDEHSSNGAQDDSLSEQDSAETSYYSGKVESVPARTDDSETRTGNGTPSFYSQIGSGGSGVVSTSFYTTLPSKEVADSLASLQAAGSLNTNTVNNKKSTPAPNRNSIHTADQIVHVGDKVPEGQETKDANPPADNETKAENSQDYEEHVEYVEYEDDPPTTDNKDENDDSYSNHHTQDTSGHLHSNKQQYSDYYQPSYDDNSPDESEDAAEPSLEFGARIRPKRSSMI